MEKETILVYVEGVEIHLFTKMEVRHALLAYSEEVYKQALKGKVKVLDNWGNEVGLFGALIEGNSYYIKENK